jgi:hypothetical protein
MVETANAGVSGGAGGAAAVTPADDGVVANGVSNGIGEGSSSSAGTRRRAFGTLSGVMREPSTTLPDVVVLDSMPDGLERREVLDPKEDLWLSTSDGYV